MPYFFIVPLWAVACVAGLILLTFRRTRLIGVLIVATSTAATLVSFLLSLGGLFVFGSLAKAVGLTQYALLAAAVGYVGGRLVGGVAGAASAIAATLSVWRRLGLGRSFPSPS